MLLPRRLEANEQQQQQQQQKQDNEKNDIVRPYISLPYKGVKGEGVLKKFKTVLREVLPKNIISRFIYKRTKLGLFFSVKDKVDITHLSGLI